ncbi:MAG: 7-cyano-7-deazaguanine synthase, partial [Candidatus Omnitrophica bacterium]|nr:7-cyano-7-deazaguanine synthase [Candidatus Omnitrophota bacterium]
MKKRVVVALSGGVDSSVAAYILLKKGYDVIGVTFKLFNAHKAPQDARAAARQLKIPFYTVDCVQEFKNKIINYFQGQYKNARTPNPCV